MLDNLFIRAGIVSLVIGSAWAFLQYHTPIFDSVDSVAYFLGYFFATAIIVTAVCYLPVTLGMWLWSRINPD